MCIRDRLKPTSDCTNYCANYCARARMTSAARPARNAPGVTAASPGPLPREAFGPGPRLSAPV
eukprot:3687911-Pyramimonas_sp.AAC.1